MARAVALSDRACLKNGKEFRASRRSPGTCAGEHAPPQASLSHPFTEGKRSHGITFKIVRSEIVPQDDLICYMAKRRLLTAAICPQKKTSRRNNCGRVTSRSIISSKPLTIIPPGCS
jgi:hypothetical protein